MIMSVRNTRDDRCMLNFGTHDKRFHCDEVVAMAILEMAYNRNMKLCVVRTKNPGKLRSLEIVVDIGGGIFDHHMAGFNARRSTGEKYASAGLVWKSFAEKAIKNVMNEEDLLIDEEEVEEIKGQIDREIIIPVDMEDNGEGQANSSHIFSFVQKFFPSWLGYQSDNDAFYRVEKVVFSILREIIKDKIIQIVTGKELQKRYIYIEDGILEIPTQTMPWIEHVVSYNKDHDNEVKFVIFRHSRAGWAAQCVPPTVEERFKQLIPFPKEWAGGNEETLPKISGVQDAILCHKEWAWAKTKHAVIRMCQIAMNKA